MPEKLKPCPFCGSTCVTVNEGSTFRWRYVACDSCDAHSGEVRCQTMGAGSPDAWERAAHEAAIAVWNRRADPATRNAALEEAARVCETEADAYLHCGEGPKAEASLRCARLIRAAKEAADE